MGPFLYFKCLCLRNDSLIQSSIFKIEDKVWAFFGHQRLCMRSDALIACCCMGSTVLKNFLAFPKLGLGLRSPMFFLLKAGFEIGILEHLLACGTESTCFVNLVNRMPYLCFSSFSKR